MINLSNELTGNSIVAIMAKANNGLSTQMISLTSENTLYVDTELKARLLKGKIKGKHLSLNLNSIVEINYLFKFLESNKSEIGTVLIDKSTLNREELAAILPRMKDFNVNWIIGLQLNNIASNDIAVLESMANQKESNFIREKFDSMFVLSKGELTKVK